MTGTWAMFDLDSWQEILDTLRKNKMRTLLTAFSVAWGILILVVLLGSGRGLSNGVIYQFRDDAINSIWVRGGQTSVPYHGLRPGRYVQFTNRDFEDMKAAFPQLDHVSARFGIPGSVRVRYRNQTAGYNVRCVHPNQQYLEKTIITSGRFLNETDVRECRKIAIVGDRVKAQLFKDRSPLGERIEVNGVSFEVAGVFVDEGSEGEMESIYIPISTAQRAFGGQDRIHGLQMSAGNANVAETRTLIAAMRQRLAARHSFDPSDERAVRIFDALEEFEKFIGLIRGIRVFIWVIGIGTLLAGVVGVSNIMMITVKERTKEIGIRKALGATPGSIMGLVLQEAVLVTALAGYVGLVAGIAVIELMSKSIRGAEYFRNPTVDLSVAGAAILLLVVAGGIAGWFPARRAAAVRPVEALRDE